ncbi:MAG: hypothetical protein ACTSYI_05580 [Promethearchaeota archaeon]
MFNLNFEIEIIGLLEFIYVIMRNILEGKRKFKYLRFIRSIRRIMGILVSGIMFKSEILAEKKFYPDEGFIAENVLGDLFHGIYQFVDSTFHDNLHKFSIGGYTVLMVARPMSQSVNPDENEPPVLIFSIIEKDTSEKPVLIAMEVALDQFFNRYSNFDIRSLKMRKMAKFSSRLEETFSDLALKLEDRFKALY